MLYKVFINSLYIRAMMIKYSKHIFTFLNRIPQRARLINDEGERNERFP